MSGLGVPLQGAAKGSGAGYPLWSPTSEASLTDLTKLSFMIEMKLEGPSGNFPGHPVVKT